MMMIAFGNGLVELEQLPLLPLVDIAQALSRIHRWNGHTPITVAQHAVMASYLAAYFPREALLHDAAEALLGDVATPIKEVVPQFRALEEAVLERLFRGWGLIWPLPAEVKRVDARLGSTEARDYFGLQLEATPYPWAIEPWGPETARERFLERSRELRL